MVSKKKQRRSPKKSTQNEDIYLNDVQVEIKQEEELIIEDADQQHVEWRFIGLDDDVNEEAIEWEGKEFQQHVYNQNQSGGGNHHNHSHNASFDEVIEISDDENNIYEEGPGESLEAETSFEILITNEPLQDSIIEGNHHQPSSNIEEINKDTTIASDNNDSGEDDNVNSGKINNTENAEVAQKVQSDDHIKNTLVACNEQTMGKVDCLNVKPITEYFYRKIMKMCCHICGTTFQHSIYKWLSHVKQFHPKFFREIHSKCKLHTDLIAICKICKMEVTPKINHTLHYITRHMEPKPHIFLCACCSYSDFSFTGVQKHQMETHASAINKPFSCPKCDETFKDDRSLEFHFMSTHIRESNTKNVYKCHLCDCANFESSKNKLYGHLLDKHKLANWKILNFRKVDNGAQLSCTKCYKVFIKTNVQHLLGHYLTHEDRSTWACKFCKNTYHFKDYPISHLCEAMRKFYDEKNKSTTINEEGKDEHKLQISVSWNEFEAYIEHVCPFCHEGFNIFEDWRLHVRELHHIHTLEGLNMTVIPEETDKLLCLQCNTHVTKSAIELHKHRFQHLPYEPYKCRHCAKCLPTYNKALCHVQNKCHDTDAECSSKPASSIQTFITKSGSATPQEPDDCIAIICTLCNNKKFSSTEQIAKHITTVHDNFEKYFTKATKEGKRACKICQMDMKRNRVKELSIHYLQHLNERPFKCQKCFRSYPTYRIALNHVQSYHLDSTTAQNKEYTGNSNIESEREENLQLRSPTPSLPQPTTSPRTVSPSPPPTPPQASPLQKPNNIKQHASKSPEKVNANTELIASEANQTCALQVVEYTNNVFKTYEQYIVYACPECNDFFTNYSEWAAHVTLNHSFYKATGLRVIDGEKGKTKCMDCKISLPRSLSKKQNHRLTHLPYKPFICSLCYCHYKAIASLYKHFRSIHFTKGPFQCALCPKMLSTDFERMEHVKKEHPSKSWPSNMCEVCLKIVGDLGYHLLTNHLGNQRKYRCEKCGDCFEHNTELESHIVSKHLRTTESSSPDMSGTRNRLRKRKLCSLSPDGNSNSPKKPYSASLRYK